MALAQNYIRMHTGNRSWFGANPETPRKGNHGITNFQRLHQEAMEEADTIKKERHDVLILNQHIAEITADTEEKIKKINAEVSAKIRDLNVERDLEVNLVRAQAERLTTHIKNASMEEDQAIAAPVEDQAIAAPVEGQVITAPVKGQYTVKLKR